MATSLSREALLRLVVQEKFVKILLPPIALFMVSGISVTKFAGSVKAILVDSEIGRPKPKNKEL